MKSVTRHSIVSLEQSGRISELIHLIPCTLGLLATHADANSPTHQSFPMGKQHNKVIKRSRRKQYLKRKKEQVKATILAGKSSKPAKKVAKKAAKKAAVKKVAKKAVKKAATKVAKKAATKVAKKAVKKTAKKAAKNAAPKKDAE